MDVHDSLARLAQTLPLVHFARPKVLTEALVVIFGERLQ
jgi:hypothetical protein